MNVTQVSHVDLQAAAKTIMLENGFEPDFPPPVQQQLSNLAAHPPEVAPNENIRDLRHLLWSSIDNDTSSGCGFNLPDTWLWCASDTIAKPLNHDLTGWLRSCAAWLQRFRYAMSEQRSSSPPSLLRRKPIPCCHPASKCAIRHPREACLSVQEETRRSRGVGPSATA
jgi:hypothetical protein